jgi:hypothetical protein
MRVTIAIFALLFATVSAYGQQLHGSVSGPFTNEEAELMSAVWPKIRDAAAFEDIDWEAVGLTRAPGSSEARRFMATHWDVVRSANEFRDIEWQRTTGYQRSSKSGYALEDPTGPFTSLEAEQLSAVWPEIRKADAFGDINWRAVGLSRAPGSREARRLMEAHWGSLRRAAEFDDIDWQAAYRAR